jgi:membrane protein required for beta-lactamase induction
VSACIGVAWLAACGRPDTQALQKLTCEHVASTIVLHMVGQLDTLRQALGLAPRVYPIWTCRSLGVTM